MQVMRKSKHLLNLPVFSLEEGQQIGRVKGLVIDPASKAVAALIIEEKGWFKEQKFIPFSRIHSIGENAVTIESSNIIQKGTTLPDMVKFTKDKINITGSRIISENGAILGQVDEYFVDIQSGNIVGLELSTGILNNFMDSKAFLDSGFIRTLGKQVTVCTNDSLNNIIKIEGGIQETMRTVRSKANHAWSSALNKSRELGSTINWPFKRRTNDLSQAIPAEEVNKTSESPQVTVILEENTTDEKSPPAL
jgi:uncharacterized protein YrrD